MVLYMNVYLVRELSKQSLISETGPSGQIVHSIHDVTDNTKERRVQYEIWSRFC